MGINSCFQTQVMLDTITKTIGVENFHVPPQKVCFDDARDKSGKALEPVIHVWLRVVDDGA